MSYIVEILRTIWDNISILVFATDNIFLSVLDIAVVTFLIYKVIMFLQQTRAEQLLKGILVFMVAYIFSTVLNLRALSWILSLVYINSIVVVVVLFQPELRSILERLGRGSFKNIGKNNTRNTDERTNMIEIVCSACATMKRDKTGALIVIERDTQLNEIAQSGTIVDAVVSANLLTNLFFKNSPLHDGALIIREDKIYAASCILPLTQNINIDPTLGTRHRAAIGVSEISDAIVIVVSEETGAISLAYAGKIMRNLSEKGLVEFIQYKLGENDFKREEATRKLFGLFSRKGESKNEK